MGTIPKTSAGKFAKRLGDALFELENMQLAYQADRQLQISIVEKYKDEKGKRFINAQKAAVRGDQDALMIRKIEERKRKVVKSLGEVWAVYTGNEKAGEIIAEYLRRHGDLAKLQKKYTNEEISEAIDLWGDYKKMTHDLYAARQLERIQRIRATKREARHLKKKARYEAYLAYKNKGSE